MATFDNLDLVRTSVEYRDLTNTTNPDYNLATRTFSFADIELLDGIPAQDQLEIERIFPVNTLGSSKYEGVQLTIADRRLMFKLPKQWYTVDVVNKTITMHDIANQASNEFVPLISPSGGYYDINTGAARKYRLLAAGSNPSNDQLIDIPGLAANDDMIIRRRTVSTEKVVNFAPGSRLTSGQLNLQVSQLVNLLQELMWKVDQEFILKFDESAIDGPFLGNKDLDMGSFSIINMGMPPANVGGDAFPPNTGANQEDIDRVGRMVVNKYFLQNVYTDYIANTVISNWNANGQSGSLVDRLRDFDISLANKQPLNNNLSTLQGTTNASGLVELSDSDNLALVTAIGELASGTNGFIKKTGAATVALDTNTYLTGNQTVTLSGAVTGSGATAITTSIAAGAVGTNQLAANAVTNDKIAVGTIANDKLVNKTISGIALGSTLATLTKGTYLTGNDYTGGTATTWAVDAATANTASKVVARDPSGNFAAGTITAALAGNATSATTLSSARNFSITGGATASAVSFNGGADVALNVTALNATNLTAGTLSMDRIASGAITDDKLSVSGATADTYANTTLNIPEITVNNKGRITSISNRDLASHVLSSVQSNSVYWDSTNSVYSAFRNSNEPTLIRGVASPVIGTDAATKGWVEGNTLLLNGVSYTAAGKRIKNLLAPEDDTDAVTLSTLAGYSLYGNGQAAIPNSVTGSFGAAAQVNQAGYDRYEFTVNELTGSEPLLMILTDSSNRVYTPQTASTPGDRHFFIQTGANKVLQVWLPTDTSVTGLTFTLRNFGVGRVLTSQTATATELGFVRIPPDGGINVSNGDISLVEPTASTLGGIKVAANNGLALTSGTLSVVRSDSTGTTDSNTLATSTAVKTAYDAAVAAQAIANAASSTANAALPAAGGTITGSLTINTDLSVNGTTTIGNDSADTVTLNAKAIAIPNGLNFDNNTLAIDSANNRVGIGTTESISVASKLSFGNYFETTSTPTAVQQTSHISLYNAGNTTYGFGVSSGALNIAANQDVGTIRLYTNSIERLRVLADGKVAIGATTANDALHVVGSILATTSLKVNGSTSGTASITAPATAGTNAYVLPTTAGTLVGSGDTGTVTNTMLAGSITDTKLNTITTANKVGLAALDIDGGTDIGADLADADLLIVDDGGAGTNRKAAVTRIPTYVFTKVSGDVTINSSGVATIAANSVALGTDTTGNYVATVTGTANQIIVGNSGTENAAVTLALPQDINTTSNPTFAGATLGTTRVGVTADNEIDTTSGNLILDSTNGTVEVDDNLTVSGDLTLSSGAAKIKMLGSGTADGLEIQRLGAAAGDGAVGDVVLRLIPSGAETPKLFYMQDASTNPTNNNEIATKGYVTTQIATVDLASKMNNTGTTIGSGNQVLGTSSGNTAGNFKIQTQGVDRVTVDSNGNTTINGITELAGGLATKLAASNMASGCLVKLTVGELAVGTTTAGPLIRTFSYTPTLSSSTIYVFPISSSGVRARYTSVPSGDPITVEPEYNAIGPQDGVAIISPCWGVVRMFNSGTFQTHYYSIGVTASAGGAITTIHNTGVTSTSSTSSSRSSVHAANIIFSQANNSTSNRTYTITVSKVGTANTTFYAPSVCYVIAEVAS